MDLLITLAVTVAVQLAGYTLTNKIAEDTAEIIAAEVRDAVLQEKRSRQS